MNPCSVLAAALVATAVTALAAQAGIRAEADVRGDKVGSKIRDATLERVNYMLVVGGREAEAGEVDVRSRAGDRLGVTGAPETLIVSAEGVVLWHWPGPIDEGVVAELREHLT